MTSDNDAEDIRTAYKVVLVLLNEQINEINEEDVIQALYSNIKSKFNISKLSKFVINTKETVC